MLIKVCQIEESEPTFDPQAISDKLKGSSLVAEDNTLVLYVVKKILVV